MAKRDLFKELQESLKDVEKFEQKKMTLKTIQIKAKKAQILQPNEIRAIRKKYNMSRAVFANLLHISNRTLEKWELGTSQPNEQASTLLILTNKYPDMFERLESL